MERETVFNYMCILKRILFYEIIQSHSSVREIDNNNNNRSNDS